MTGLRRRDFLLRLLGSMTSLSLAGCDNLSRNERFTRVLGCAEGLNRRLHHVLARRDAMAREYKPSDISAVFRANGTTSPMSAAYQTHARSNFVDWRLAVTGLVGLPLSFSLSELRQLPSRTQITRHDCVEGWSVIGKWKGAKLSALLEQVRLLPQARYVVFHCADPMDESGKEYYESIDLDDAYHAQTILAYELNDQPLPMQNGAPLRLRVERQLGYKHAKYVMQIELVENFSSIGRGQGGYWEDLGYEWYAGI
ncbi:MAG: molybdopterin-binding protein [Chromatiales bacterium]